MIIEQTVEIPASRQIFLDLPPELPVGRAMITITPKLNEYTIIIAFDDEAQKWYAQNDDIPIILEDYSLDKLINRVKLAVPEMLEINNKPCKDICLVFKLESQVIAD